MNILVVEDEDLQRESLVKIIERNFLDIRVYQSESIKEAKAIIEKKDVDLFLIDINLGDGSGLELAKYIRNIDKHVLTGIVFITTNVIHIIEAFKSVHCYDFLVKPYNVDEVKKIVSIFLNKGDVKEEKEGKNTFFTVDGGLSIKIYHSDILFIEYISRNCIVHTIHGKYSIKGMALSKLLEELKNDEIIQTHKAYAINTQRVYKVDKIYTKLWEIYFNKYEETAQLGYKYKNELFERLGY